MTSLCVIIAKDLRLLLRDRIALIFIVIAPIIVTSVAGFSLGSLYGATPSGQTPYELPIVDEDGGTLARRIDERLAGDANVRVRIVGSRAEAQRLVRDKAVGSALVIPAGTGAALAAGRPAHLLLYTDPVKYLERLNVRLRVLQALSALTADESARLAEQLTSQFEDLHEALARVRAEVESLQQQAGEMREQMAHAMDAEAARIQAEAARQVDDRLKALATRVNGAIAARVDELRRPALDYLDALAESRRQFEAWFAQIQRLAGRRAEVIPPPPTFPEPPPELQRVLSQAPKPIDVPDDFDIRIEPRLPPPIEAPDVDRSDVEIPRIEVPPLIRNRAALTVDDAGANGAPTTVNSFDQNVPGFSVTFLLLGMLLGVSLGIVDEREWGTFDRVRSLPVPAGTILIGKLASRCAVGVAQLVVLFAVGRVLFGVSLGPQPWALLLPIAGIAFAGTAFGLIIAAVAPSRDAVLPLGSIVIVTMAAVGGCWWPIVLEPHWMRTTALAFPTTWAMEAFNDLMIRRRSVDAAYAPAAMLMIHGLTYLVVGLVAFRRRIART